tara:strand:- start:2634 stop:2834 length:201 start_codon:yes stop_codon:yes gene_type:complete
MVSFSGSVNEWTFSFERKWGILLCGGLIVLQPLIDKINVAITAAIVSFFFISLNNLEEVLADLRKV